MDGHRFTIDTFGDQLVRLYDHAEGKNETDDTTGIADGADVLRPEGKTDGH